MLGKLSVQGRPSNMDYIWQGPAALEVGAGGACSAIFLSSTISFFFLPLSGRRPDID